MLLAIDPGLNSPGAALFRATGELLHATRIVVPETWVRIEAAGQRWLEVAKLIVAWSSQYDVDTVVFEKPQWDERSKKVDPNDLVSIAGVAANVTGHLRSARVLSPTPSEWIGQLSKKCAYCKSLRAARKGTGVRTYAKYCTAWKGSAWNTPRGRRIRSRLTPAEFALVPDQNDAIDAVGLGLWSLGRLAPRQVFSNGKDGR